jgi:cysteine desulfurase
MGAITHGSVRVSFLHDATEADVDRFLEVLPAAVADLREMAELDTQAIERATEGSGRRGPGNPEGVPRSDKTDLQGSAPGSREGR